MSDADRYFGVGTVAGEPAGSGRYLELEDIEPVEFLAGLVFRPVLTDEQLVNFVHYEPHTVVPQHTHVEQQITFVLEGEFEFSLAGDVRTLRKRTVAVIPPWVPHAARTYDNTCLQVDIFVPPRAVLAEVIRSRLAAQPEQSASPTG